MKSRSEVRNIAARSLKLRNKGFTLIEMVVVISMILILLAIALPMYNRSILHAREARLHQDLATLNKAIEEYALDKKKAPQSLDDLMPGYIKFIPDDITGSNTWVTVPEESEDAMDPAQTGIKGVKSGSEEVSSDGSTPYSAWTR
jgi:general secretion pathway protein G